MLSHSTENTSTSYRTDPSRIDGPMAPISDQSGISIGCNLGFKPKGRWLLLVVAMAEIVAFHHMFRVWPLFHTSWHHDNPSFQGPTLTIVVAEVESDNLASKIQAVESSLSSPKGLMERTVCALAFLE